MEQFYVHGSVYHKSISVSPTRCNNMQSIFYFTAKSLYMFRCHPHPSSGVHKTVITASGTCHISVQLPHSNVAIEWGSCTDIWHVPEAVITVLCTPDDGHGRHPKHIEWFCRKIEYRLHIVASRCTFIDIEYETGYWYFPTWNLKHSKSNEKISVEIVHHLADYHNSEKMAKTKVFWWKVSPCMPWIQIGRMEA